jgi:hypothetical protein
MTDRQLTVQNIVARCGGAAFLATQVSLSAWAVYKWYRDGIPNRHWPTIIELSGVSAAELYHADRLAKTREGAEVAA